MLRVITIAAAFAFVGGIVSGFWPILMVGMLIFIGLMLVSIR